MWGLFFCAVVLAAASRAAAGAGAARLVCYADSGHADRLTECTHLVYAGDARGDKLDALLKEYRKSNPRVKIVVRVGGDEKDLRTLFKSKHVQGLELHDAHKSLNKTKVLEAVEAARAAISASGGGPLFLALPAHPELLAKYYDLRTLVKKVDLLMVQTHALGVVKKLTYHPSRLSGMWDMMNTDSVVDLVVGLGVPASKVVISVSATARQFTLLNETLSTPGSPTLADEPREIGQAELCRLLQKGRWTLERDQDLSAPYAFKDKTWMSFEDSSSLDVKGKYARVRGLAGVALHQAGRDDDTPCGPTLRASLAKVLNQQSRAPRAAVLRSLEHEILSGPGYARALDALQVSPYRITQIVDSDGVIHSIREDTRTEFSCSRQGYFVHPRSCARFYRCVKFDQLSPEYTVFEFDCPSGLAFDSRYEVCVWPGSLPHSQACPGSSEIAPVPQTRFVCPHHEGYYADPENCRWFFACLDHGKAPLTAYEFRCPFGLGFDAEKLKCDWPWLVPACGNIARYEAEAHGFSAATLTGAAGFQGQTADSINIAAHQSLVSGASLNNLVGIQGGFLSKDDALDTNFIASQEFAEAGGPGQVYHDASGFSQSGIDGSNGLAYQDAGFSQGHNLGLVQATNYNDANKYTSGSIILDDYRLPTKEEAAAKAGYSNVQNSNGFGQDLHQNGGQFNRYSGYSGSSFGLEGSRPKSLKYQSSHAYDSDNSGAYVHDSTGDRAEPYKHEGSPVVPYLHDDSGYKKSSDSYDYSRYSPSQSGFGSQHAENGGQYSHDNSGEYVQTGSTGAYRGDGFYSTDYSGLYTNDGSGQYVAGVYRNDGHIGTYGAHGNERNSAINLQQYHGYSTGNSGNYLSDSKAYTGASHTLTAGAVNVGLVGKTTLVDANDIGQGNYHTLQNGHVPIISRPAVAINHVGTDFNNLDGYSFVTTPTTSGIPTTATPFAVTTALPSVTTYKTNLVPEAPKSSIKHIFGISQPAVTYVQPTVVAVNQYVTPKVQVTDYNQGINNQYASEGNANYNAAKLESTGYVYSKPNIKFEDGISQTTPAPVVVSTFKPQGFSHSQQTLHKVEFNGYEYSTLTPITEQPYKKLVAYTTGPPVTTYAQPTVASYTPQAFSHQTIHKVETNNAPVETGYEYNKPSHSFEYTTAQPAIVYQPKIYSQQTLHKVDASQVKFESGYNYEKPASGYDYPKPAIKFEEAPKTEFVYSTPAPIVSTYKPHSYSHQTFHKVETPAYTTVSSTLAPEVKLTYHQPAVSVYENPILKYTENITPVPYVQPAAQSYSHQTIHKVESGKVYTPSYHVSYEQPQTVIQYTTAQPALDVQHVSTSPQVFSQQTFHKVESSKVNNYEAGSGYTYEKPAVNFEEAPKIDFEYSTPAPAVVSTYKPQSYSHQTIHNFETKEYVPVSTGSGYNYEKPEVKFEEAPRTVFQYSTSAPAVVSTYKPQSYNHQTIHNIETKEYLPVSTGSGYSYEKPQEKFEEAPIAVFVYSTPAPAVVSTYKPQSYSHQTIHNFETKEYVPVSTGLGYNYEEPKVKFEEAPRAVVQYSTPAPAVVSTHKPQSYSHQTIHNFETKEYVPGSTGLGYNYEEPKVKFEEAPRAVFRYSTPAPAVVSTYKPQSYSHQTIHNFETKEYVPGPTESGYSYEKPEVKFEETPRTVFEYSTPAPTVVSTYKPKSYSHQTVHNFETKQYVPVSTGSGYSYKKPEVNFEEVPKTVFEYSTAAPAVVSTYKPNSYNHQTIHTFQTKEYIPVSSTPAPIEVTYKQPSVTFYANPLLTYTQKITPVEPTPAVYTQNYQPIVQQHQVNHVANQEGYSYSQPEIQRDNESYNSEKAYSDASLVSHQVYHQTNAKTQHESRKDVVFVSTTPSILAYEDHYAEYEAPKKQTYKASEYIPPQTDYHQTHSVPSISTQQSAIFHHTQDQYDYKPIAQQYDTVPIQQVSFSTSHVEQPKSVTAIKYKQTYDSPEIQGDYNAEEYLPPAVSTVVPVTAHEYLPPQTEYNAPEYLPPKVQTVYLPPSVTTTYKPQTYSTVSTTHEYLPPQPEYTAPEYLPPVQNTYLPPSTTARPVVKSTYRPRTYSTVPTTRKYLPPQPAYTTPEYLPPVQNAYLPPSSTTQVPTFKYKSTTYKAPEYLPPLEETGPSVVNYESFGFRNDEISQFEHNPYQEYTVSSTSPPALRKQNLVVETAKSHLLGFGTVGPDAGLVSPVAYTTSAPVVSSSYAPELVEVTRAPVRRTRPKFQSTTQAPYVESTPAYRAPEYLPPLEEVYSNANFDGFGLKNLNENSAQIRYNPYQDAPAVSSTTASVQRKQNIVVETSKSHLLGFGTVGSDAGIISPATYTTSAPVVSSTYAIAKQGQVEVSPVTVRRTKPKVAVVTKINDFNPLLVRKLGAVCSCQSPVVVLKGRRPNVQLQQDYDDYSNDYDDGRGDISDSEWAHRTARIQTKTVTTAPAVTSTFNPIIVPEDSYYQDYQDISDFNVQTTPKTKQIYSENFVSSTPVVVSTTQRVVKIRPRGKAVTVAPTYRTVLLNQDVTPAPIVKGAQDSVIDSQSFDRYGPGGLRSRAETLQGSVDCQRAGLFRHPKQCNKFYACRWDDKKLRFTLHVFNCPVQLSFDPSIAACNWPSQGPACQGDTLLTNTL